ncbi:MAG: DJ-1/PfpI family protein [Planctomycetes bacterium]|nr:DJ-1/PfpI family protein [Planctomycetota bacterium]
MKEALFVLIDEYADWEPALLAAGLRRGFGLWEPRYSVRTVAPGSSPVISIGGFRTMPDYTCDNAPDDFAALILIGGTDWFGSGAAAVLPLVRRAIAIDAVLGAICDASVFLGAHGFLNAVNHTSNGLGYLQEKAGAAYTGETIYRHDAPSVRDKKIVTANGAGFIDFAMDVLDALEAAPREKLDMFSTMYKQGLYPA